MKFLKGYNKYLESLQIDLTYQIVDLMESLNIWHDVLLSSIGAEQVDIFTTFSLPDEFKDNLDIEFLNDNVDFLNSLASIGLKKSSVQNTDDFQTFVNKPCRFMLIYDINSNELENPEFILFQVYNSTYGVSYLISGGLNWRTKVPFSILSAIDRIESTIKIQKHFTGLNVMACFKKV
jgi:hypothetical protein